MNQKLYGVICYWEYDSKKHKTKPSQGWQLKETFPVDMDGYPLVTPSTGGGDRHEWDKWLYTRDEDDYDADPIMGRAVTLWCMCGVSLMGFNPPEYCKWLSVQFYEELRKLSNWHSFLEDGHSLYLGTQEAARKVIEEYGK